MVAKSRKFAICRKIAACAPSCSSCLLVVGRTDVALCRTRPGASAGTVTGGGAATEVACGGRKVAILTILHRCLVVGEA